MVYTGRRFKGILQLSLASYFGVTILSSRKAQHLCSFIYSYKLTWVRTPFSEMNVKLYSCRSFASANAKTIRKCMTVLGVIALP